MKKYLPAMSALSLATMFFVISLELPRPLDVPFLLLTVFFGTIGIQIIAELCITSDNT